MNSLVQVILIIFSVFSLGYGDNLIVSLDHSTQKTEVNSFTSKFGLFPVTKESTTNDAIRAFPNNQLLDTIYPILEIQLSSTEWDWQIRKTGVFCSEVMNCWVRSSYDILVDFEGFGNLANIVSNSQINTKYAISQIAPLPPRSNDWIKAKELNDSDFIIPAPNQGFDWNLWNLIEVDENILALDYENTPTITFTVIGITDWIDLNITQETNKILRYKKVQNDNKNKFY